MSNPDATACDAGVDELHRSLRILHAQLLQCSGGGFEAFDELRPDLRDSYLCGCADLAGQALKLALSVPAGRVTP